MITADINTKLGTLTIRLRLAGKCTAAAQPVLEAATTAVGFELTRISDEEALGFEVVTLLAGDGLLEVTYARDDAGMCDGSEDIATEVAIEACANVGCVPHEG